MEAEPAASRRTWAALLGPMVSVALLALPGVARAQLRTCVEIAAAPAESDALTRLVRSEIDRHPTHRAATGDCESTLTVEVIDLGPGGGKWITGRLATQVPHRERVGGDGLAPAVERLLTVVLHNDPLILRGPESQSWLVRQERAMALHSTAHYGLEAYELAAPLGGRLATLPGVALSLLREVDQVAIGVRLAGAFDPGGDTATLHLAAQFDAQIEATFYFRPVAPVTLFASTLVGLDYQRFEGPAPLDGPGASGVATGRGLAVAARLGIEAMRTSDVRLLAFIDLELPAFASRDPDHGVVDQWVPVASLGAGVLF
jgi:hypothetical protein